LSQKTIALKDNKIIIKSSEGSLPGAKLTLNASTLTTVGTDTWKGIEVWGDEDKAQLPDIYGNYYQGFLEMKNLSLIENSLDGIELWKPADYTKTGGIIKAYNSTFRNNAKPIHALLYPKFYSAEFIKCTFEITDGYHGAATFYKHIDLNQVRGFRFTGCHFSVDPAAPNVSPYNAGIMSFNSGFTTTGYCTSQTIPCTAYENSTFDGFYSAVYASGTNSPYTFCVTNSTFTNNTCGVKVNAVNNFAVLWSDFYIGYNTADDNECDGTGLSAASYGINASASTGFAIEENYFTKAQGAPAGNYVGIRIYETKNIDQIYMNQFENLSYGNYTEGKNWKGYQSYDGLAFYCNENTGNFADFYVAGGGLHGSGVQSFQGSATHPAGNTFSQSGATWHFYNGGDHPIIYYYDNSKNANPAEKPDQALLYNVFPFGINVPTVCLSHYGGIGGTTDGGSLVLTPDELLEAEQLFSTSLNDFNNIQALYNQLKDGGNTEALKTEVETTFPSEMWEMRDELLAKSPHLTFEVLKATVDKTDVFPNAVLMEILSANPDELRNKELLTYLTEKENPLPEYMIDILRQVAGGITYRTVLEQQMSALNQSKTRAANDIVRSLLNDSITDMAALRTWLTNIGGQRANEQIIATYLQEGNQQEALALATMLPDLHNYDAPAMSEHTMYMNLLNLQVQMNQQGKPLTNLDSTEVNSLVAIAENGKGTAGAMARGLLESNYGYHFCDCITAESNNGFKSGSVYNAKTLQQIIGGSIEVNPNPATDWTNFNYTLPVMDSKGEIVISDVTGTVVQKFTVSAMQGNQIWDTRNIKPGVYYYMFTVDGFSQNGKIVVTH
ncbi:MAG: T9SS type A sorting domain-containing protein, partial [Bacteroidales bacterium]|nr:T9SS type A sorting domain-containing protein [Bacteroidales bacterium]